MELFRTESEIGTMIYFSEIVGVFDVLRYFDRTIIDTFENLVKDQKYLEQQNIVNS